MITFLGHQVEGKCFSCPDLQAATHGKTEQKHGLTG